MNISAVSQGKKIEWRSFFFFSFLPNFYTPLFDVYILIIRILTNILPQIGSIGSLANIRASVRAVA